MNLQEQCISLHEEIEAIGQLQLQLRSQLESLAERKEQVKKAIKKNLKQQEVIWEQEADLVQINHLKIA